MPQVAPLLLASVLASIASSVAFGAPLPWRVAGVFGDHMVLQHGVPLPLWGEAPAGTSVEAGLAGAHAETRAGVDGRWRLTLPAQPIGGPHELRVRSVVEGADEIVFHDVLFGEVWLAGGQSNMEFALAASSDGETWAETANHPGIRFLTVPHAVASAPRTDIDGAPWTVCSPTTAPEFSAVAYHFARQLHLQRRVPVGIVCAAWSGSPAQAWISAGTLADDPTFGPRLAHATAVGEDWAAGQRETDRLSLEREHLAKSASRGLAVGAHRPGYVDDNWTRVEYPATSDAMHAPEYAIAWMRREIELPTDALGQDLTLTLGRAYEWDRTFFNGEEIGSTRWDGTRRYRVPRHLLRAGRNVVAVRLYFEWGMGQLGGVADRPVLESRDQHISIPLTGPWRFNTTLEPPMPAGPLYHWLPSAVHNGMISPLQPLPIRGVLWYQGEGNAGQPEHYTPLLTRLIADWRQGWQDAALPFLVVQLPNIDASLGPRWPELRAAQATVARNVPGVGLVVTIDCGEPFNIHPPEKRTIGERLCRLAQAMVYREAIVASGPEAVRLEAVGTRLRITFACSGARLVGADNAAVRGFELADLSGDFQPAEASIESDATVVVASSAISEPRTVRYAWASDPDATLRNSEGLPAAPFCLEIPPAAGPTLRATPTGRPSSSP